MRRSAPSVRLAAAVDIDITTLLFPTGTGFGEKLQLAPEGRPLEHESVTAALNDDPVGLGSIVSWYGPVVCPALTVWLGVAELTEKS
jgi:hypothetical protein